MTRIFFVLSTVALVSAAPGGAREVRHHALPPVPQSADIAALNRESLAKIKPVSASAPADDTQQAPSAPGSKRSARKR